VQVLPDRGISEICMKRKLSMAGLGALMIMVAIYFFPLGQDVVILYLTNMTGSQVNAWMVMYMVCFVLLFAGAVMGGAKALGVKRLNGIFRVLVSNPIGLLLLLAIAFIIFSYVTTTGMV
jgi:hypothetical protein